MTYRFGDFALDTSAGELRRGGEVVRLQPQPAQVLALLVERAGQVVSREALRDAVWGAETFVDFDKGLNFAVAQVRAALGDDADAPTYVRTLPKRGYQFVAAVTREDGQVRLKADTTYRDVVSGFSRTRTRLVGIAVAALIIATGVTAAVWRARTPPVVAIIAFDNETGAADLDRYRR